MTRVLLLGASGFLGGHVVSALAAEGGFQPIVPYRTTWDLCRPDTLLPMLEEHAPDVVLNMAAISSTGADKDDLYRVNAFGHLNLLEALDTSGFGGRLVYFSSSNIYGAVQDDIVTEDTRPLPMNHYSCAKLLAEHYCAMFSDRFETAIVRPFNTIGPGQKPYFLLPKLARHFVDRAPEIELGNTKIARDFVDARDLAQMVTRVVGAASPPPVINLSNGEAISLDTIFDALAKLADHRPQIRVNPAFVRDRDILYQCGDNRRIRGLGYRRKHNIEDTVEWIYTEMQTKEASK